MCLITCKRMSNDSTRLQLGINQPLGMALSENRFEKGIETVTKSGCGEHEFSEIKYNSQEAGELISTAHGTEAAITYSTNLHIEKSAETRDSLPPSLTDSESESDYWSEPESDQEYAIEKISIKHQPDSTPNITDNASAGGIGQEKVNHEDDADLTTQQ